MRLHLNFKPFIFHQGTFIIYVQRKLSMYQTKCHEPNYNVIFAMSSHHKQ